MLWASSGFNPIWNSKLLSQGSQSLCDHSMSTYRNSWFSLLPTPSQLLTNFNLNVEAEESARMSARHGSTQSWPLLHIRYSDFTSKHSIAIEIEPTWHQFHRCLQWNVSLECDQESSDIIFRSDRPISSRALTSAPLWVVIRSNKKKILWTPETTGRKLKWGGR